MKRCFIFILWISFFYSSIFGQSHIKFEPTYESNPLVIDSTYSDQTKITSIRFYIGHVKLLKDSQIMFEQPSYQLMDAEFPETLEIQTPLNISYNKISFSLGIDSVTNYQGALTGDLDPQNGMYWTWQSGYINFKIEGESNQPFTYHIGGHLKPFNTYRKVTLSLSSDKIYLPIDAILQEILAVKSKIMSPSKVAVKFADLLFESFFTDL
ncbi:MAG: hypothetical protein P8I31_02710 [Bacteroidia bacterium]|nr:hypothetical protein [Bacteroidia bacterium]